MTNEQKARKFAEDFCSAAGESYGDVMDGYDPDTGGDDLLGVVINASDVVSLESDVKSLLDQYQPLLDYILYYGSERLLPNMNEGNSGEVVYEIAKKLYAGEE